MSDADIKLWLKRVESLGVGELVKGLVGADPVVQQCVLRNLSDKGRLLLGLTIERVRQANLENSETESGAHALAAFF